MLEMPDLFERHMSIGQKHFETDDFVEAVIHFEEAYNLKDDVLANVSLTKSLIEVEDFDKAYQIMKEHKKDYLLTSDYQEIYFNLLTKCHYFLEIEKLFLSPLVEVKPEWVRNYELAKEYQLVINQKKFEELTLRFMSLVEKKSAEQGVLLKLMSYFPKTVFVDLAKELLVDKRVSIFSKTELVNQLVQLEVEEEITLLTWEQQVKVFHPNQHLSLFEVYQENLVLNGVSAYYTENNSSLKSDMIQLVKLHIGCLYPFENETMIPVSEWVNSYINTYGDNKSNNTLESIYSYQQRMDEEVTKLLLFP